MCLRSRIAMEEHSPFQSQRSASEKMFRSILCQRLHYPQECLGFDAGIPDVDLETILTRIPAVREEAWNPGNLHIPAAIPFYLFELNPRHIPEDRTCPRTLNGEHGNIIRNIGNGHIASRLILEKPSPVLVTGTRVVHDKASNAADSEDGEIVHNSTLRIAEERILAPSDGEL